MSMVSVSAPFIACGVRFYVIYVGPRSSVGVVKGEDVAKKTAEVMVPTALQFLALYGGVFCFSSWPGRLVCFFPSQGRCCVVFAVLEGEVRTQEA